MFHNGQMTNMARNTIEIIPAYFSIHSQALWETTLTNLYQSKGTIGMRLKAANQKFIIEKNSKNTQTISDHLSISLCDTSNNTQ